MSALCSHKGLQKNAYNRECAELPFHIRKWTTASNWHHWHANADELSYVCTKFLQNSVRWYLRIRFPFSICSYHSKLLLLTNIPYPTLAIVVFSHLHILIKRLASKWALIDWQGLCDWVTAWVIDSMRCYAHHSPSQFTEFREEHWSHPLTESITISDWNSQPLTEWQTQVTDRQWLTQSESE